MAEDAKSKLQAAYEEIEKAMTAREFGDASGDAIRAVQLAFRGGIKVDPTLLGTEFTEDQKLTALKFFMRVAQERKALRGVVKQCLVHLFATESTELAGYQWLVVAAQHEEVKALLVPFLEEDASMEKVVKELNEGPKKPPPRPRQAAQIDTTQNGAAGDKTSSLLFDGMEGFRKCDFIYPTGLGSEHKSDLASEAFTRSFSLGVSRLHTSLETKQRLNSEDSNMEMTQEYAEVVIAKIIPEADVPRVLEFLVSLWEARKLFRGQVESCAGKLMQLSPAFRKAAEARNLPWLASEKEDGLSGSLETPAKKLYTVVWIDGNKKAFETSAVLTDAGLDVKGFIDDPSAAEKASQKAEAYILEACCNPFEEIVAVIINSGEDHKEMLIRVSERFSQERALPIFIACTKKEFTEFKGTGVCFITSDWAVLLKVVLEEFEIRKAGGHSFKSDQQVYIFSPEDGGWIQAIVDHETANGIRVTSGSTRIEISRQELGRRVRVINEQSEFRAAICTSKVG